MVHMSDDWCRDPDELTPEEETALRLRSEEAAGQRAEHHARLRAEAEG